MFLRFLASGDLDLRPFILKIGTPVMFVKLQLKHVSATDCQRSLRVNVVHSVYRRAIVYIVYISHKGDKAICTIETLIHWPLATMSLSIGVAPLALSYTLSCAWWLQLNRPIVICFDGQACL